MTAFCVYFGYMAFVSLCVFCTMGFVGVSSSLWFNIHIFATIATDEDREEQEDERDLHLYEMQVPVPK
jgi:hypothetical protein